jgi:hypothetical protein
MGTTAGGGVRRLRPDADGDGEEVAAKRHKRRKRKAGRWTALGVCLLVAVNMPDPLTLVLYFCTIR